MLIDHTFKNWSGIFALSGEHLRWATGSIDSTVAVTHAANEAMKYIELRPGPVLLPLVMQSL